MTGKKQRANAELINVSPNPVVQGTRNDKAAQK